MAAVSYSAATSFIAGILALMLAIGGGWIVYQEGATYLVEGRSGIDRTVAALDHPVPAGISMLSRRATLLDCRSTLVSLDSLTMRYYGPQVRTGAITHCEALADVITERAPNDSLAWYVGALAAAAAQDWPGMSKRLRASQISGPNEQWVAQPRASLAEDNFEHLDGAVLAGQEQDLKLLVSSGLGIRSIARRYVTNPEFRERIITIVETLPPLDQRRFATNVRLQAQSQRLPSN